MSEKLAALSILGALILGYPLGLLFVRLAEYNRLLARICGLVGALMAFIGILDLSDIRFLVLAETGIYLQIAWLVASFKSKRMNRAQYLEFWASPQSRNNSPGPAPAPGTPPAGQVSRQS